MKRTWLMAALLGGSALVLAMPAQATITFSDMNTGGIGEVNILFDTPDTGTTIFGQIDHSGVNVGFSSLTGQTLLGSGNGQADIQNAANPGTAVLTSMDIKAATNTRWGDFILNLNEAGGLPSGCNATTPCTARITAIDNLGNVFTDDVLETGNNFTTVIADTVGNPPAQPPEFITEIQVVEKPGENNPAFGWTDFKQPRVSDAQTCVGTICTPIPTSEPSTLATFGSGLLALGLLLLRRRMS